MMQWKNILIQSMITLALLLAVFKFCHTTHAELLTTLERSCSEQTRALESRLEKIEKALAVHEQGGSVASGATAGAVSNAEIKQMLVVIADRLTRLEKEIGGVSRQKSPVSSAPPVPGGVSMPRPGMPGDPAAFMQGLPEEKRRKVNEIFKDQAGILQSKMSSPGDGPPNLEAMKTIMDQNDQELREKLKGVLNEEEYQKFEGYLPKSPGMPAPLLPGSNN